MDVAIPEIARFGLTGIRRLAYYCWLFRVRGAVECSGSAVSTAAALTAAALYVPVTNAIAAPAPFVVMPVENEAAGGLDGDGTLAVSAGPGLGMWRAARLDGGRRDPGRVNIMKITRVRVHQLAAPMRRRFGWSLNWTSRARRRWSK